MNSKYRLLSPFLLNSFAPLKRYGFKSGATFIQPQPVNQMKISSLSFLMNLRLSTNCGCYTSCHVAIDSSSFNKRHYVTSPSGISSPGNEQPEKKPSLYQRFKIMYRDYWYVLLPVHLVTSAAWFGGFYYMASSGVDIISVLEQLGVSEKLINPLRNGHATTGYIAISYALYKIATPLRYTVTLGGTTVSINYLKKWGYIKPMPSKEKLKELYADKKEKLKGKGQTLKDNMIHSLKPTEN